MKDDSKAHMFDELNGKPRDTRYEVTMNLSTDDGLDFYDAFVTEDPPQLPDVGEYVNFGWVEDENEEEVHHPVDPENVGTDYEYEAVTSLSLEVKDISTTYSKRNYMHDDGTVTRKLTIKKTVTLSQP